MAAARPKADHWISAADADLKVICDSRRRILEGDTALTGQPDYSIRQRNPEEY